MNSGKSYIVYNSPRMIKKYHDMVQELHEDNLVSLIKLNKKVMVQYFNIKQSAI